MMERSEPGRIQVILNGVEKETVHSSSIMDLGWFVKSIASREGIKNFTLKVNGDSILHQDLGKVKIPDIKTLELSTFDVAR